MPGKARTIVLTESQAACLIALRHRPDTKTCVAIAAKEGSRRAQHFEEPEARR